MTEIGGYYSIASHFEDCVLDDNFPSFDFNSGRNALLFALIMLKPVQVYFPYFTCSSIHNILSDIHFDLYHLDSNYLPIIDKLPSNSVLIINNYFGNMLPRIKEWLKKNSIPNNQVIIDNTHSLNFSAVNEQKFYQFFSPRKFLGVPDGGILHTPKLNFDWIDEYKKLPVDSSLERIKWVFNPLENMRNSNYQEFLKYRETLQDMPVSQMSKTTKFLLRTLDYKRYLKRRSNVHRLSIEFVNSTGFWRQHSLYSTHLSIGIPVVCARPLEIQKQLAKSGVYVVNYWPGFFGDKLLNHHELDLLRTIILPIDIYKLTENPNYHEIIKFISLAEKC